MRASHGRQAYLSSDKQQFISLITWNFITLIVNWKSTSEGTSTTGASKRAVFEQSSVHLSPAPAQWCGYRSGDARQVCSSISLYSYRCVCVFLNNNNNNNNKTTSYLAVQWVRGKWTDTYIPGPKLEKFPDSYCQWSNMFNSSWHVGSDVLVDWHISMSLETFWSDTMMVMLWLGWSRNWLG